MRNSLPKRGSGWDRRGLREEPGRAKFTGAMTGLDLARSVKGSPPEKIGLGEELQARSLAPGFSQRDLPKVQIPGPLPTLPCQELKALESAFLQTALRILMHTFRAIASCRAFIHFRFSDLSEKLT